MNWAEKNGGSVVDLGVPVGHGKSIKPSSVSDGKSTISGHSVLQGET
jgi:hypothetical protein